MSDVVVFNPPSLEVVYTNWRGETKTRRIRPMHMWYGTTEWHPEPGWLLHAYDFEKEDFRDFAWSGFVR